MKRYVCFPSIYYDTHRCKMKSLDLGNVLLNLVAASISIKDVIVLDIFLTPQTLSELIHNFSLLEYDRLRNIQH